VVTDCKPTNTSATSSILLIHPVTESVVRTLLAKKEGKKLKQSRYRLRGFEEVKVSRFHDNSTG
jgi:hypothetical protein